MLLLSFLFTVVCLLFIYALMRDTGKHTPHARLQERRKQPSNRKSENTRLHVDKDTEVPSAG